MDSWWTCSSVHSAHPLEEGVKEMLTRGQPWDQPSGRRLLQTGLFPAPLSVGADSAVILFFGELSCGLPGHSDPCLTEPGPSETWLWHLNGPLMTFWMGP